MSITIASGDDNIQNSAPFNCICDQFNWTCQNRPLKNRFHKTYWRVIAWPHYPNFCIKELSPDCAQCYFCKFPSSLLDAEFTPFSTPYDARYRSQHGRFLMTFISWVSSQFSAAYGVVNGYIIPILYFVMFAVGIVANSAVFYVSSLFRCSKSPPQSAVSKNLFDIIRQDIKLLEKCNIL